jgi:hypothetical protein
MTSRENRDCPDVQDEVIAFLRRPASYGLAEGAVETVETHISIVFLAGEHACKLKRAVKYPYLDFLTPDLRRAACEAELTLNRRTAPQLYLEVRAIGRRPDGTVGWGGGSPLDWVVAMRRFEQHQLLDQVARAGRLSTPLMLDLAAQIAAFHGEAEFRPDHGGAAVMAEVAETNIGILRDRRSAGFPIAKIDALAARVRKGLALRRSTRRAESEGEGAALPWRFAPRQYLHVRREAAAVRRPRIFRGDRQHRRAVRPGLFADGFDASRAAGSCQSDPQPLPRPDRRR